MILLATAPRVPRIAVRHRGGPMAVEEQARPCPPCGHAHCGPKQCTVAMESAGEWYWMRSPDQEQRVVMGLYNRYCIRCHAIDGRGVWDIPDVPDFTDVRWQTSRTDRQLVNILMEGRGPSCRRSGAH